MVYKGFEILLERQTCEFFTLQDDGEVDEYDHDCHDSSHDGWMEYVAFDKDTGERFIGATDLASLQAYIYKVCDEAAAKEQA